MSRRKKQPGRGKVQAQTEFAEAARKNLPAEARTLIANARNDITIPFYSGVMQHADDTLIQQGGGKGLAIYDEIERDTQAFDKLQKRKKHLVARAWEVEPAGKRAIDKAAAQFVREVLQALPFDRICEDLMDATLKGFAVSEVVWKREGDHILPDKLRSVDQRRIVFDEEWRPRLLTWASMHEGIELPERKFVVHRFGVKGNNPYGLGLGTRLFWPVLFKREGVAFWLHFLEKFAGPTIVGKTPYGTLTEEQSKLLNTLVSAKTASAITVPIGTEIDFLEASRGGTVSYEAFIAYWDRQISICITGETLTSQVGDSGSRALGDVHEEMLALLVDSDADLLSDTLREQLLTWLIEYNMPGAAVPYVWRIRPANELATAKTRKEKAGAATDTNKALLEILRAAANFEDDELAREYIVSFDITDQLSDKAIEGLVAARHGFATGEADPFVDAPTPAEEEAAFASWLKKKR